MATRRIKVGVGSGYTEKPNYDDLLEKRKKVKSPTSINLSNRSSEVRNAYDDSMGDSNKIYNELSTVAQMGNDDRNNVAIASNRADIASAARHNTNVTDAIRHDKEAAAYKKALSDLAKARGSIGYKQTNRTMNIQYSAGGGGNGQLKDSYSLGGLGLSKEQQGVATAIVNYGKKHGFSDRDVRIALITAQQESGMRNLSYGDRDSGGVFQQRPSQGWGTYAQVRNVDYSVAKFYSALKGTSRAGDPWNVAQRVQRSFDKWNGGGTRTYKKHWGLSGQILARALNPVGSANNEKPSKGLQSFMNRHMGQYTDYDHAFGTQCVDLFRYYINYIGKPMPGPVGGAKNIWTNGTMAANFNRVSRNGRGKSGDIAVFGGSVGGGYGHVGIVLQDMGDRVKLFNSHSGNKRTDITIMSKSSLLGYWRK